MPTESAATSCSLAAGWNSPVSCARTTGLRAVLYALCQQRAWKEHAGCHPYVALNRKSKGGGDSRPFLHFFTGPAASCGAPTPAKRIWGRFFGFPPSAEARKCLPSSLLHPLGLEASGACASVSGLAFLVALEALLFFCPSKASRNRLKSSSFVFAHGPQLQLWTWCVCDVQMDGRTSRRERWEGLHFFFDLFAFLFFFFVFVGYSRQAARIVSYLCGFRFVSHAFDWMRTTEWKNSRTGMKSCSCFWIIFPDPKGTLHYFLYLYFSPFLPRSWAVRLFYHVFFFLTYLLTYFLTYWTCMACADGFWMDGWMDGRRRTGRWGECLHFFLFFFLLIRQSVGSVRSGQYMPSLPLLPSPLHLPFLLSSCKKIDSQPWASIRDRVSRCLLAFFLLTLCFCFCFCSVVYLCLSSSSLYVYK